MEGGCPAAQARNETLRASSSPSATASPRETLTDTLPKSTSASPSRTASMPSEQPRSFVWPEPEGQRGSLSATTAAPRSASPSQRSWDKRKPDRQQICAIIRAVLGSDGVTDLTANKIKTIPWQSRSANRFEAPRFPPSTPRTLPFFVPKRHASAHSFVRFLSA